MDIQNIQYISGSILLQYYDTSRHMCYKIRCLISGQATSQCTCITSYIVPSTPMAISKMKRCWERHLNSFQIPIVFGMFGDCTCLFGGRKATQLFPQHAIKTPRIPPGQQCDMPCRIVNCSQPAWQKPSAKISLIGRRLAAHPSTSPPQGTKTQISGSMFWQSGLDSIVFA